MYSNKKKIVVAAFIVMLAVVLATSTTYAWLSMDTSPEVRYFDVNVTAGDSMTIAVTTIGAPTPGLSEFKTFVDSVDIGLAANYYDLSGNVKASADSLTTATTQDTESFALVHESKSLASDEGAYYGFDIHFMGNDAYNVRLAKNTTVTSQEGATSMPAYYWQGAIDKGYATQDKLNQVIPAKAANAVRIAFGNKIFEPNHNAETSFGNFGGENNIAIDYYNRMRGGTPIEAPAAPLVFNSSELNGFTHKLTTLEQQGAEFYTGKLSIKIWLEGWDADAFDSIKEQVLTTFIRFEGDLNEDILAIESINEDVVYDGQEHNISDIIITADSLSEGALSYSYKKQGSSDAFTQGPVQDAGLYTARIVREASTQLHVFYPESVIYVNFEISPKEITVTAIAGSKEYGAIEPDLDYEVDGLVNEDELEGTLIREEGENAGSYAILLGTLSNPNYKITFEAANFVIIPKEIEVTADSKSKIYGQYDPVLTYTITQGELINDDILIGYLERAEGINAGSYAISQGTLANPNYNITFVSEDFIINKADYDMSGVSWIYTSPFIWTGTSKVVTVTGLPEGITVNEYVNNTGTDVGSYTASVIFYYDTQNYNTPTLAPLDWEIVN